jgi:hypothetical protein
MPTPKSPMVVPAELTTHEPHPIVAKAKASLVKKYKPTRSEAIDDGVAIAWYLVALGRAGAAAALARDLGAAVTFNGNHSLWSPAADALCLAARLAREAQRPDDAATYIARIVANPAFAVMSRADFAGWVAEAAKDLAEARDEPSAKWARNNAITAVTRACYFRETAGHGFYYDAWVDAAALDAVIAGGVALLAEKLAGKT